MKRLLLLGGAAAGVWAWLRGRRRDAAEAEAPATVTPIAPTPPPPAEPPPAPAAGADQAARDAESRLDDETKDERPAESGTEEPQEVAERPREDPLSPRPGPPPDEAA